MNTYSIFVLIHLLSVAIGFGGALVGDYLFMISLSDDKKIDKKELKFLKATGTFVWLGLILLIVSGFVLFYMRDFAPLKQARVQAKMTLVAIVFLNGILFHKIHLPFLNKYFIEKKKFKDHKKRFTLMFISGGLSFVSWLSIILLASWRNMTYKYTDILIVYLSILFIVSSIILFIKDKKFKIK